MACLRAVVWRISRAWSSWGRVCSLVHDEADAGFAFGDGGESNAGGHEAGFEEGSGEGHGGAAVAEKDGDDGGFEAGVVRPPMSKPAWVSCCLR